MIDIKTELPYFQFRVWDIKEKAYHMALTDAMFEVSPQGIYSATFLTGLGDTYQVDGKNLIFELYSNERDYNGYLICDNDYCVDNRIDENFTVKFNGSFFDLVYDKPYIRGILNSTIDGKDITILKSSRVDGIISNCVIY